eukprot:11041329-Ditylum_brightwellii.AAC.1
MDLSSFEMYGLASVSVIRTSMIASVWACQRLRIKRSLYKCGSFFLSFGLITCNGKSQGAWGPAESGYSPLTLHFRH